MVVHIKCAQRGQRGPLDRSSWRCNWCQEQEERKWEESRERQELNERRRDGKENLTILQWNCDHLGSKAVELTDFLRRNRVDVALLQETKLRAMIRCGGTDGEGGGVGSREVEG